MRARLLVATLLASLCASCGSKKTDQVADAGATATPGAPGYGDGPVTDRVMVSLYDLLPSCDIDHRGLLLDLGTEMMRGRVRRRGDDKGKIETTEHHGATWAVVDDRSIEATFTLAEPTRLFLSARIAPEFAKNVGLYVDDQSLGGAKWKLPSEPRVVETEPTELPFDAGEHTVSLRFGPAKARGKLADVDWIRVGFPDEIKTTYGPPTIQDVQQPDAALSKVPHRALRLRAPSTIRCPLLVPKGARFRTAVGVAGGTEAMAEVAVRVDGAQPTVLLQRKLKGGEDATWEDVDASLEAYEGQLVQLEMRTAGAPGAGRVLFGDPEVLVSTAEPEGVHPAQVVVVVVFSGLERGDLPNYADHPVSHLERLSKLAERSATFHMHRASANVVPANLATLLTGLPPQVHTVTDYGVALPDKVPTLAQKARDAAVQTALFTGVPHSFAPAKMGRGLSKFVEISPIEGEERDPLGEAAKWLEQALTAAPNAKLFLVVHARGGHPPWHVPPKQLDVLPPENYTGDIQPRRAAQQLSHLRRKSGKADVSDQDMIRLGAFYQLALIDQDKGVGALLDALDAANVDEKTLFIVTSDLSSGLSTFFADAPPLDERTLELPLYVKFPDGRLAGRKVDGATRIEDVSRTIANALGLEAPKASWGRDLAHVASGVALQGDGPSFALFGDAYTVRWSSLVLRDRRPRATLCDLSLDPTCAFDRRPLAPFISSSLVRALADYRERIGKSAYDQVPLTLDDGTLSALKVWGAME